METLPRGNGWKLMTTGGTAKAQVLDFCLLSVPPGEKKRNSSGKKENDRWGYLKMTL